MVLAQEKQMHAVTAISGSGPAYYFEAMHYVADAIAEYTLQYPDACDEALKVFETSIKRAASLGVEGLSATINEHNPIVQRVGLIMGAADQKSRFLAGEAVADPASRDVLARQSNLLSHKSLGGYALPSLSVAGSSTLEHIVFSLMIDQYLSAQKLGLSAKHFWALVLKTAQGAQGLATIDNAEKSADFGRLADAVTSKNGTTDAACKTAQATWLWKAISAYAAVCKREERTTLAL